MGLQLAKTLGNGKVAEYWRIANFSNMQDGVTTFTLVVDWDKDHRDKGYDPVGGCDVIITLTGEFAVRRGVDRCPYAVTYENLLKAPEGAAFKGAVIVLEAGQTLET